MKRKNIIQIVISLILIMSIFMGAACSLPVSSNVSLLENTATEDGQAPSVDDNWSAPSINNESISLPTIADVVAEIKPSVVAIDTEVTYSIFNRSFTQEGAGSGWIIDENGIIVTNYHVIEGAETITVTLDDGRSYIADPHTIAADPWNDLAILKIDADNLSAAKIGDSSLLNVGDWLVAIGNSLGLGISAKEGIVSRLNVSLSIDGQVLHNLVETSAAINPGNSGGPLVNMKGEVIGITSVKISSVGVEGLGYAISMNEAMPLIEALITGG